MQDFLTNFGAVRLKGLDLFAKLLGKPGKMEGSGDKVQALFDAGEQFKIDDYCLSDVMDTYFVFLRTRVMTGDLSLEREQALVAAAKIAMEEKRDKEGYFKWLYSISVLPSFCMCLVVFLYETVTTTGLCR